jgi:hypothetical protein
LVETRDVLIGDREVGGSRSIVYFKLLIDIVQANFDGSSVTPGSYFFCAVAEPVAIMMLANTAVAIIHAR